MERTLLCTSSVTKWGLQTSYYGRTSTRCTCKWKFIEAVSRLLMKITYIPLVFPFCPLFVFLEILFLNVNYHTLKSDYYFLFIYFFIMTLYTIFDTILAELVETNPLTSITLPNPYQEDKNLEENIINMFQYLLRMTKRKERFLTLAIAYYISEAIEYRLKTPTERTLATQKLTQYYSDCCLRIFEVYELLGIDQIYRTTEVKLGYFRRIKIGDVKRLGTAAMNEAAARFSQELED